MEHCSTFTIFVRECCNHVRPTLLGPNENRSTNNRRVVCHETAGSTSGAYVSQQQGMQSSKERDIMQWRCYSCPVLCLYKYLKIWHWCRESSTYRTLHQTRYLKKTPLVSNQDVRSIQNLRLFVFLPRLALALSFKVEVCTLGWASERRPHCLLLRVSSVSTTFG